MTTEAVQKTNTAVAKPSTGKADLEALLNNSMDAFRKVAPKHLKIERVIKLMLAARSRNPALAECTSASVLQFCMRCSETGLEPIGAGGAWPVPFRNKNGAMEVQFIPDYRGLINSAKRAKVIKDAYAEVVRENDEFDYTLGLEPTLTHKPSRNDRGDLNAAYCVIVLPDGTKRFTVMDGDEVEGIRKRSKAGNVGPWQTDPGEMWKKTAVRRAMKPFAGAAPELDAAIEYDNEAAGIVDLGREPIRPPKIIEAEALPHAQQPQDAAKDAPQPSEPAKPAESGATGQGDGKAFVREEVEAEVLRLLDASKASKIEKAMKSVGITWESGDEWRMAGDDKLIALVSLLKG